MKKTCVFFDKQIVLELSVNKGTKMLKVNIKVYNIRFVTHSNKFFMFFPSNHFSLELIEWEMYIIISVPCCIVDVTFFVSKQHSASHPLYAAKAATLHKCPGPWLQQIQGPNFLTAKCTSTSWVWETGNTPTIKIIKKVEQQFKQIN